MRPAGEDTYLQFLWRCTSAVARRWFGWVNGLVLLLGLADALGFAVPTAQSWPPFSAPLLLAVGAVGLCLSLVWSARAEMRQAFASYRPEGSTSAPTTPPSPASAALNLEAGEDIKITNLSVPYGTPMMRTGSVRRVSLADSQVRDAPSDDASN